MESYTQNKALKLLRSCLEVNTLISFTTGQTFQVWLVYMLVSSVTAYLAFNRTLQTQLNEYEEIRRSGKGGQKRGRGVEDHDPPGLK